MPLPDFTSFHPGYERDKRKKEAERRKTLFRNHRSLAGCGAHPLRARTPSGVPPRLWPEGLTHPNGSASGQASRDRRRRGGGCPPPPPPPPPPRHPPPPPPPPRPR